MTIQITPARPRTEKEIREHIDKREREREAKRKAERKAFLQESGIVEKAKAWDNEELFFEAYYAIGASHSDQAEERDDWRMQEVMKEFVPRLVTCGFLTQEQADKFLKDVL
jgi:hypothetical protein